MVCYGVFWSGQYQVAPGLPNLLESVRQNIGFPVVRTDGRSAVSVVSRDYQISWDG